MNELNKKRLKVVMLFYLVLALLDVGTTIYAFNTMDNVVEKNPLMRPLPLWSFLPIQLIGFAVIYYLLGFSISVSEKTNQLSPYGMLSMMWLMCGIKFWVVVGNFGVLL